MSGMHEKLFVKFEVLKGEILRVVLAVNFCDLNFVVKMILHPQIMDEFLFPSLPPSSLYSTSLQHETDQGTSEEGRRQREGRFHSLVPDRRCQRLRREVRSPG